MKQRIWALVILAAIVATAISPALASPPAPNGEPKPLTEDKLLADRGLPYAARPEPLPKNFDQPNPKDYWRNREQQLLREAGQSAEASLAQLTGTDRVLVILVEFAGTDVFTWTAPITPGDPSSGSQWDPLGRADPNEFTGVVGDCSNIITQTQVFTYSGPLHNMVERPRSYADASGDSIWTGDFTPQWFTDFMFGNGVLISYTRQDASPVHESFIGESVRDFYSDASNATYTITGDVIGWVSVPHSTWYYDTDMCPGARSGASVPRGGLTPGGGTTRQLVRDALDAVNAISNTIPGFDWHNYDQDGDGIIDRLWIVHAGYGEEDSSTLLNRYPTDPLDPTRTTPVPEDFYGEASVWSHSSAVTPPYSVTHDVAASPYIVMPENGGMGVFSHEYGHNLGATDLYAYGAGDTSAGFWTVMSDDWTGYPIGFEPPAVDPYHLDNWGWLEPAVINDTSQVYTITLGQASRFNGNTGPAPVYRGARIELPDQQVPLPLPPWQGSYYWWGGDVDLSNGMMTSVAPVAIPGGATAVTLSFDLVYDIETEWDFLWVQVSTDGTSWDTLSNTNTICTHNPSWIGYLYGFPDDLCAAGIGGFSGFNAAWPSPEFEVFDLSAYAGQSIYLRFWYMTDWATIYTGPFVDRVGVSADGTALFYDDAEGGGGNWAYQQPWIRSNGAKTATHNYYLQWRNINANGGYDSALGDPRWRFGPANTGLIVWYNNNSYSENEVFNHLFDWPSFGPKGLMLAIDSHAAPYRQPWMVAQGYDNEGGNVYHRSLMRDAPFTLQDTVDFTLTMYPGAYPYTPTAQFTDPYAGRPAANEFNDAFGYYPGSEWVSRGPGYTPPTAYRWVTTQWDASTVVPATAFYALNAPGYVGTGGGTDSEFRYDCASTSTGRLSCYWLGAGTGLGYDGGTGNPGDTNVQYGWHVQLIEEGADHTWVTLRIFNVQPYAVSYAPALISTSGTHLVTYNLALNNEGVLTQTRAFTFTLDPALTFVAANPPLNGTNPYTWTGQLLGGESLSFTLVASITTVLGQQQVLTTTFAHNDFMNAVSTANLVTVVAVPQLNLIYLPLVPKSAP